MLTISTPARRARAPRTTIDASASGPADESPLVAGRIGASYSMRICGRCRTTAQKDGSGRDRCVTCGRTRGWL